MYLLNKIIVLGLFLVIFGCGEEQATSQQTTAPAVAPAPAMPAMKAEKTMMEEKPQWAVLEQNVIHYSDE